MIPDYLCPLTGLPIKLTFKNLAVNFKKAGFS